MLYLIALLSFTYSYIVNMFQNTTPVGKKGEQSLVKN